MEQLSVNYDLEILCLLNEKHGFSDIELFNGLNDQNSQISILYQKLIDQKLKLQIGLSSQKTDGADILHLT
jgi:hypothetical protein